MSIKAMLLFKPWRTLFILLAAVVATAGIAFGTYMTAFAVSALKDGKFSQFYIYIGITAACIFIGYFSQVSLNYVYEVLIQRYFHSLREHFALRQYAAQRSDTVGAAQNRLTNDLEMLRVNKLDPFSTILTQTLSVIMAGSLLVTFHWSLLAWAIGISVLMAFPTFAFSSLLQKAGMEVSRQNKSYLTTILRWFGGIAELRQYAASKKFLAMMGRGAKGLEDATVNKATAVNIVNYVNIVIQVIAQMGMMVLAGFLFQRGLVQFGAIVSAGDFAGSVFNGIFIIANAASSMQSQRQLNNEVKAQTDAPSKQELASIDQSASLPAYPALGVDLESLAQTFESGERTAYPTMQVKAGEKVLLTGDSGVGKSTLLRIIAGIDKPSSGEVRFTKGGKPIDLPLGGVGYIPQKAVMFPDTVEQNMTMFKNDVPQQAINEAVDRVGLRADAAKFPNGLDTMIDCEKPNLSGGQEQKVALARTLLRSKPVVLVDEGTASVDRAGAYHMASELVKTPATVIFVAHNIDDKFVSLFDREIHLSKQEPAKAAAGEVAATAATATTIAMSANASADASDGGATTDAAQSSKSDAQSDASKPQTIITATDTIIHR